MYSEDLVSGLRAAVRETAGSEKIEQVGFDVTPAQPSKIVLLRQLQDAAHRACESILSQMEAPDLIHIQHEYGFFGSKLPGLYWFPHWVRELRDRLPQVKIIATAHTVITETAQYPVRGRGWQVPLRSLANFALIPGLKKLWGEGTWGGLNGVIVHSRLQLDEVRRSLRSGAHVIEIPHYSPEIVSIPALVRPEGDPQRLLVFGYITPEKGQDLVIEALSKLEGPVELVIAGGLRREADRKYVEFCEKLIRDLGLQWRVMITGVIEMDVLDSWLAKSDLVVAPFRETSGSGSLVNLLCRGAPILASGLELNREIAERVPGALALFAPGDPDDCAQKIRDLLASSESRSTLKERGLDYARKTSALEVGRQHLSFYRSLTNS